MKTSTAIGAGRAIMRITVPEMRQRLYPIRGGMNEYVKSKSFGTDLRAERLSGTHGKDKVYQITSQSKSLKNKGTNKIFRVFSDVDKRTKIEARKRQGNR